MFLDKRTDEIEESDLQELVERETPEGKTIDYKEFLPGKNHDQKKDFLIDVSALANASGGYLIFGMREQGGIPVELCGLADVDVDKVIQSMENSLRDNIQPRVPGVSIAPVSLASGKTAIVVHVPRSWSQPHVVDFKGHWRFYSRNSIGNYPLDVNELRNAFDLSASLAERIRAFRSRRLGAVVAGETPVLLEERSGRVVLHIVSPASFDSMVAVDLPKILQEGRDFLHPIYSSGGSARYNLDGVLVTTYRRDNFASGYVQMFRNGVIESVDARLLQNQYDGLPHIPSIAFEGALIESLTKYMNLARLAGLTPPLYIMVSLLGVKDYKMAVDRSLEWRYETHLIDRDDLILPEIAVDNFQQESATMLKPIFDAIWNATGWPHSLNYRDGKWVARH